MRPPPPNYGPYSSEQGALQAIVDRLVADLKPFRIYLFGSRAAGRARPDSDFDLVVVFDDDAPNSESDYDEVFAPVVDLPIGCDVIPCRWSDFQEYWRTPPIPGRTLGVPPAESMSVQRRRIDAVIASTSWRGMLNSGWGGKPAESDSRRYHVSTERKEPHRWMTRRGSLMQLWWSEVAGIVLKTSKEVQVLTPAE